VYTCLPDPARPGSAAANHRRPVNLGRVAPGGRSKHPQTIALTCVGCIAPVSGAGVARAGPPPHPPAAPARALKIKSTGARRAGAPPTPRTTRAPARARARFARRGFAPPRSRGPLPQEKTGRFAPQTKPGRFTRWPAPAAQEGKRTPATTGRFAPQEGNGRRENRARR
jgi:hypothetical protein